jgi:drug/metabolite transporter (DMT)-like permease
VFSLLLHYHFEVTVAPSTMEWVTLISMGVLTQGLAYMLWNHGVHYGNYRLLSILSYSSPIISIFLLIIFGFANLTPQLLMACTLMCFACIVARTKETTTIETPQLEVA